MLTNLLTAVAVMVVGLVVATVWAWCVSSGRAEDGATFNADQIRASLLEVNREL